MGILFGNSNINEIYFGTTRIREVYYEGDLIWPLNGETFEVSPLEVTNIPAAGNTIQITVTANCTWTVSSTFAWLTPSVNSGENNGTFNVVVSAYSETSEPRTGTVTVIPATGTAKTISFTQVAADTYSITVNGNTSASYTFDWDETGRTFIVNSSDTWTATADNNYFTLSRNSGPAGSTELVVTPIGNNEGSTQKETTITLTNHSATAYIYVWQKAKPYITFNELNPSISCEHQGTGSQGVNVLVQSTNRSKSEWTLTPSESWIHAVWDYDGYITVTVDAAQSYGTNPDTGSIDIYYGNTKYAEIGVTRAPWIDPRFVYVEINNVRISEGTTVEVENSQGSLEFRIFGSSNMTVDKDSGSQYNWATWGSQYTTNISSGSTVTLNYTTNSGSETRTIGIYIATTDGKSTWFNVEQSAYEPTVTWRLEPSSITFSSNPVTIYTNSSCTNTFIRRKYEDNVATSETESVSLNSLNWSSGDTSIATVSNGVVTGSGYGTTTIYATDSSCSSGHNTASGSIEVNSITWRLEPANLTFSPSSIVVGNTATCSDTIRKRKYINGSATNVYETSSLNWSSVNTSVATVSNGTVSGVAAGSTTISATDTSCEIGYQVASGSITVTAPSYSISVSPTSLSWDFNETGSKTISVSTNDTGWTYTFNSTDDWFTCTRSGNILTITPDGTNDNSQYISGSGTVTSTHGATASFTVVQDGEPLDITNPSHNVGYAGGSVGSSTINVASGFTWDYEVLNNFLSTSVNGNVISITSGQNTGSARTGIILIKVYKNGTQVTAGNIEVHQSAYPISVNNSSITFNYDSSDSETIVVSSEGSWIASLDYGSGQQNWLTVSPLSGSSGDTTVTITHIPITDQGNDDTCSIDFTYGSATAYVFVEHSH